MATSPAIWLHTLPDRAKLALSINMAFEAFLQREHHDHLTNPPTRLPRRMWIRAIVDAWREAGGVLSMDDEPLALPYIPHAPKGKGRRRRKRRTATPLGVMGPLNAPIAARASIEQLVVMQRDAKAHVTGKRPYHKSRKVLREQIAKATARVSAKRNKPSTTVEGDTKQ